MKLLFETLIFIDRWLCMKKFLIITLILIFGLSTDCACKLENILTGAACSVKSEPKRFKMNTKKDKNKKQNSKKKEKSRRFSSNRL